MGDETLVEKEKKALEVVKGAFRVAAAILASAVVEVILIVLLLLGRTSLGESFTGLVGFFPVLAALASIPIVPFAHQRKYWFFVLIYAAFTAVLMWYFQISLFVLWGNLYATGGGV